MAKDIFDCAAASFYNSRVFETTEIAALLNESNLPKLPGLRS